MISKQLSTVITMGVSETMGLVQLQALPPTLICIPLINLKSYSKLLLQKMLPIKESLRI